MKVYVYPADYYACGHYRMIWPALVAQNVAGSGVDVKIVEPVGPTAATHGLYARENGRKVVDVTVPSDADLVVIQRPTMRQMAEAVPIIRSKGVAVVVDIDDDLTAIHPGNPAWGAMHPKRVGQPMRDGVWEHSWQYVTTACKAATMVTVSTPALVKRYAGDMPSRVLWNCVPESFLEVPHDDGTTIAWAGSMHSHPDDLKPLGGTIMSLGMKGHDFMVVGNGVGAGAKLGLRADPPFTGNIEFEKWISAVAQIGIGVAPLADTKFNAAKSWLKPLEYSTAGVPWVASPRVEYARLHERGAGLLANRPRDWEKALSRVLASPDLRADLSGRGRDVARSLTIERHIGDWLDAWTDAVKFEQHLRAKRAMSGGTPSTAPAVPTR